MTDKILIINTLKGLVIGSAIKGEDEKELLDFLKTLEKEYMEQRECEIVDAY